MADTCLLAEHKACCCTCRFHLRDFHHCTTVEHVDGCVCSLPKGWICAPHEMERAYSGWSEHGICEMHLPKQTTTTGEQV